MTKPLHGIDTSYSYITEEFEARCACGWVRYARNPEPLLYVALWHQVTASVINPSDRRYALRCDGDME